MAFTPAFTLDHERLTDDENGLRLTGRYDVAAQSLLHARQILRDDLGLARNEPFRTAHGESPSPPLICRELDIEPKRAAPLGGTGLYAADFEASQKNLGAAAFLPDPVPGGPPVYLWDANLYSSRATVDRHGQAIKNTAGQVLAVAAEVAAAHLEVLWYVTDFTESSIVRHVGSINAKAWHGFAPGQAQCKKLRPEPAGPDLYLMRAQFDGRAIGWDPKPFNEGTQELYTTVPVLNIPIYGANYKIGDSLPGPRPLDDSGRFLPANAEGTTLEVELYEPIDYRATLGI